MKVGKLGTMVALISSPVSLVSSSSTPSGFSQPDRYSPPARSPPSENLSSYTGSSHPEISSSPESSASPAALHLRETRVRRCSVCCSDCDEEDDEEKEEDEETKVFGAREIEQEDESRDPEVEKPAALPGTEALPGSTKFWQCW